MTGLAVVEVVLQFVAPGDETGRFAAIKQGAVALGAHHPERFAGAGQAAGLQGQLPGWGLPFPIQQGPQGGDDEGQQAREADQVREVEPASLAPHQQPGTGQRHGCQESRQPQRQAGAGQGGAKIGVGGVRCRPTGSLDAGQGQARQQSGLDPTSGADGPTTDGAAALLLAIGGPRSPVQAHQQAGCRQGRQDVAGQFGGGRRKEGHHQA